MPDSDGMPASEPAPPITWPVPVQALLSVCLLVFTILTLLESFVLPSPDVKVFFDWKPDGTAVRIYPGVALTPRWRARLHYITWHLNLTQSWGMFAPAMPHRNQTMMVQALLQDGSHKVWRRPLPYPGFPFRTFVRFTRWQSYVGGHQSHRSYLRDALVCLSSRHLKASNPPRRLKLVVKWSPVPPPQPGDWQPLPPPPQPVHYETLYTWRPGRPRP